MTQDQKLFQSLIHQAPKNASRFAQGKLEIVSRIRRLMKIRQLDCDALANRSGIDQVRLERILRASVDFRYGELTQLETALESDLFSILPSDSHIHAFILEGGELDSPEYSASESFRLHQSQIPSQGISRNELIDVSSTEYAQSPNQSA